MSYNMTPTNQEEKILYEVAKENTKRKIRQYTGQEMKGKDLFYNLGLWYAE